jgi:hypothetical protein
VGDERLALALTADALADVGEKTMAQARQHAVELRFVESPPSKRAAQARVRGQWSFKGQTSIG